MEDPDEETEANKLLARLQREVALDTKKSAIGEMSHAWRWIMASVLALNSGGLIAALAKVQSFQFWSVAAIALFYFGVMIALAMGWKQISLIQRIIPIHSEAIVFWEGASLDGHLGDLEALEKIRDKMLAAGTNRVTSNTLSRISFFLFSAGLACLACSVILGPKDMQPTTVEAAAKP